MTSGRIFTRREQTASAGLVSEDPYGERPLGTNADVHSIPARTSVSYVIVLYVHRTTRVIISTFVRG